jgi:hypothetical protein
VLGVPALPIEHVERHAVGGKDNDAAVACRDMRPPQEGGRVRGPRSGCGPACGYMHVDTFPEIRVEVPGFPCPEVHEDQVLGPLVEPG